MRISMTVSHKTDVIHTSHLRDIFLTSANISYVFLSASRHLNHSTSYIAQNNRYASTLGLC